MKKLRLSAYVTLVAVFGLLSYFAHQLPYFPGDVGISQWVQKVHLPLFELTMRAVSYISSFPLAGIIVALVVILFLVKRRLLEAIFTASLAALEALINLPLKILVDRARPSSELVQVLVPTGDNSFPSGHALYALTFYGFIFYVAPVFIKKGAGVIAVRIIMLVLILLTALSRIYLGAHWLSDVMGGLFLGSLLLAPAIVLYQNYRKRENAGTT